MPDRKRHRRTICWIGIACLLLFGAVCWLVMRPRTAVIVTIDNIEVAADGRVTIAISCDARRDSMLMHGWRAMSDGAMESADLGLSLARHSFIDRWWAHRTESLSMEFATPHPASAEPLVETGQRFSLVAGEKLSLIRVDREVDGHIVRQESFLAARDSSEDTLSKASQLGTDGDR